jgi:DNA-binding NtrC family response regulator
MTPAGSQGAVMPDAGTKDIIIADNDYIIRDILRSVLAAQGLNVLSASDGYEAIATRHIPPRACSSSITRCRDWMASAHAAHFAVCRNTQRRQSSFSPHSMTMILE